MGREETQGKTAPAGAQHNNAPSPSTYIERCKGQRLGQTKAHAIRFDLDVANHAVVATGGDENKGSGGL